MIKRLLHKRREVDARAHVYLGIMICRLIVIGLTCLLDPASFTGGYTIIAGIAPLWFWGSVMISIAAGGVCAIIFDNAKLARIMVLLSAVITGMWAFSLIGAAIDGVLSSIVTPIVWLSLTAKDLVVVSIPYAQPVDKILMERPEVKEALEEMARIEKDGS